VLDILVRTGRTVPAFRWVTAIINEQRQAQDASLPHHRIFG
jgi:hypothetical protein